LNRGQLLQGVTADEFDPVLQWLFEFAAERCARFEVLNGEGVDKDERGEAAEGLSEIESLDHRDGVSAAERGRLELIPVVGVAPTRLSAHGPLGGGGQGIKEDEGADPFAEVDESDAPGGVGGDVDLRGQYGTKVSCGNETHLIVAAGRRTQSDQADAQRAERSTRTFRKCVAHEMQGS